jgi:hypothetical protein
VTFVAGLVAGILITTLGALFVFQARVIEGADRSRMPDLRSLIAVAALIIAIVALARSGQHDTAATTAVTPSTAPTTPAAGGPSSTAAPGSTSSTSSSTTSTTVLREVNVPKVIGLTRAAAIAALQSAGLRSHVQMLPLPNVPPGFVVTQSPEAFSTTSSGAVVSLGVSSSG